MSHHTDHATEATELTIRMLGERDLPALRRLAGRDSAGVPALPVLGAELGGELVAALAIGAGETAPIADPFVATAEAVALLQLRAGQLRADCRRRRGRRRPLGQFRSRLRARGAIAGSPPGGGTRLLEL